MEETETGRGIIERGEINEYPYVIYEHPRYRHLNGYLGVYKDHPWYGKSRDDIEGIISVHGGVTWSSEDGPDHPEIIPDHWWIGFDCGHAWDIMPGMEEMEAKLGMNPIRTGHETYKDRNYVYNELVHLVQQAEEVLHGQGINPTGSSGKSQN